MSLSSEKGEQPRALRRQMHAIVMTTVAIIAFFVFLSVVSESETFAKHPAGAVSQTRIRTPDQNRTEDTNAGKDDSTANKNNAADQICTTICEKRRKKDEANKNLLDLKVLLERVSTEKERLVSKLREDYGEYFEPIFVEKSTDTYRPCAASTNDGPSLDRLKRKLMIKILSMQVNLSKRDSDVNGCDCSNGKSKALRNDVVDTQDDENENGAGFFERYVWATGGHSAAAGHGNLYNESYTAYMERDVKDAFGSIGIDFEGRNYAMGGQSSSPGISMCWREIFGNDVDFFSWDYGMTDGKDINKLFHYTYRGAMSASRPAAMIIHYGGRDRKARLETFQQLEKMGMASFRFDEDASQAMKDQVPDSTEIADPYDLPPYVRNYKCGTSIEKGDPYCGTEKYSKWGCAKRLKQASWHPGFKDHALVGHGIGLFLVDTLLSTLRELGERDYEDIKGFLSQLLEEDREMHHTFLEAEIPENFRKIFKPEELPLLDGEAKIDASLFFKGNSVCHTANLPSQTRYQGILTDTNQVGKPAPVGEETYYLGVDKRNAEKEAVTSGELRLVYDVSKERETECVGVLVKPDYPDYFYTNSMDGWSKLVFPNDAEKKAYGYDTARFEGILIIIGKPCPWNKCPPGLLTLLEDYERKKWELKINGQHATKIANLGGNHFIVGSEDGFRFKPNSNGNYDIEIKVIENGSFLWVNDFVLF